MKNPKPVSSDEFTIDRALLIIHCRDAYDHDTVRRAALWILGSLDSKPEDVRVAMELL